MNIMSPMNKKSYNSSVKIIIDTVATVAKEKLMKLGNVEDSVH